MKRETRRRVIRSTMLYLLVAGVFLTISFATKYTIGDFDLFLPYLPSTLKSVSLSKILIPVVGGSTFIYLAGIFGCLFEGQLNQVFVGSFYSAGIVGFLAFYLILQPDTRFSGLLILAGFSVFVIYSVFSTLADIWNVWAVRIIAGSVAIFAMGEIIVNLMGAVLAPSEALLTIEQIIVLKEVLFWGFTAACMLNLTGVFKTSRNSYLASIGGITSNYLFSIPISLIGSLYVSFVNGRLLEVSPVIAQLRPYIEWTGIVLVAGMIFTVMRRGMNRSMMSPTEFGSWSKHIQDTSLTKGERLSEFTQIIDNFIEEGARSQLLVKLFTFLRENRASEAEVAQVLSELINYEDERLPAFSFTGRAEDIRQANRDSRMAVLNRTVRRIKSLDINPLRDVEESSELYGESIELVENMEDY
ncbi:MAG: hypothetical protein ACLFVP_01790 [Candidatus Bathyarchaeia archaeon]